MITSLKFANKLLYITIVYLNLEYIEKHTAYFTINNNVFEGNGKEVIKKFVNQSQFIVYGEMHDSKQTSIITKALMPLPNVISKQKNVALSTISKLINVWR